MGIAAFIAATTLLSGCHREPTPPPSAEPSVGTPSGVTATASEQVSQADAAAAQRLLDYLQSLLQRGEFEQARRAVAELENLPMTPAQRQRLQQIKAQLPPA